MASLQFRNLVTLVVIGGLIGGSGGAIVYDSFIHPQIIELVTETSEGDTITEYLDNSLKNNNMFNIWIGAILGYGGAIITFLYQGNKTE